MMDPLASLCWLHTQILMLQFLPFPGFQTVRDPSPSCTLNRVVGESVQLPLNHTLSPDVREIEWKWNTEAEQQQLLVSWKPSGPEWYEFEDKYKHRLCLTEKYILNISNLTVEMSGLYVAEIKYNTGKSQKKDFRLCVHEPIPEPQIRIHSLSNTPGWCNVSLECGTPETTENLTVTWLSNGFPRELEQRGTLSAASNSRNLSLSLPLSQSHGHLTCVVSNSADQKNATVDLGSICPQRGSFQSIWLWRGVLIMVLVVSLGAGVWIWKRKKMETERAPPRAGSDDPQIGGLDSHDLPYAEISPLRPTEDNLDICLVQTPKLTPAVHTVYEKIHKSPKPKGSPRSGVNLDDDRPW
ncbi:SLAM family member 9-like isoform X2 [Marmota marmota marmota]|uniref:SLAM family member 9-like isoform X2 n=1 Tax=Marmota marmota marmota TaxID=9994 RepID=UPI002092EA7E|nr:SLAM family member 9-like isoform X2 [Marmota marmota marmota]